MLNANIQVTDGRSNAQIIDYRRAALMTLSMADDLAHKAPMGSSAALCASDARYLYDAGRYADAQSRALDSLKYSIGVFSPDYADCVEVWALAEKNAGGSP